MARALVLDKRADGVTSAVRDLPFDDFPEGDVVVRVLYSSLNYKDALAVTGRGKIIRGDYPFVPGIDLVGRVEESESGRFKEGDLVLGTGWGLGEAHWGGYSEVQRLESSWLVSLPTDLTPPRAMLVGTAGFTAMLSMMALEDHGVTPDRGEVLVTGASGGVGSMSVALLHAAGFEIAASTGSADAHDYLRDLGARRIIDRAELEGGPRRPMDSAEWAGAVDVVGGSTLATIVSRLQRHASVAACGLAGGHELHTTVYPFILRGVNLLGIDSNTCPNEFRQKAWQRLTDLLSTNDLERMEAARIGLEEVPAYSERLLAGQIRGRIVVDVQR